MAKQIMLFYPSGLITGPTTVYDHAEFVGGALALYTEVTGLRQNVFGGNLRASLPGGQGPWKVIIVPVGIAWPGTNIGTGPKKVDVLKWLEPGPNLTLDSYTRVDNFEHIGDWAVLTVANFLVGYHNTVVNTVNIQPTT